MTAAGLEGATAVLLGPAPTALVGAVEAALRDAGARVARVDDEDLDALDEVDVGVCFALPEAGERLADTTDDALETALEAALTRPRRRIVRLARRMHAGGGGAIVVVGSIDARHAYPRRAAASVAMGGLLGLVRSVAVELADGGVRANLVIAGPLADDAAAPPDADDALVARTLQRSPVGRFGSPREVAAAIRFVAADTSGFMTGQTLRVDGGWASLDQAPEGMRFP